jgi:hypothetical protein
MQVEAEEIGWSTDEEGETEERNQSAPKVDENVIFEYKSREPTPLPPSEIKSIENQPVILPNENEPSNNTLDADQTSHSPKVPTEEQVDLDKNAQNEGSEQKVPEKTGDSPVLSNESYDILEKNDASGTNPNISDEDDWGSWN